MAAPALNNTEVGLKTQIVRQRNMKEWAQKRASDRTMQLFIAYVQIWATTPGLGTNMFWDFVKNDPEGVWVKLDSKDVGVYSHIAEYTNTKGTKSQVHYTENGRYIGSVKKLGDKPISYTGNFRVNIERFLLNTNKLNEIYMEARRALAAELGTSADAMSLPVHHSDVWDKYSFASVFSPRPRPVPEEAPITIKVRREKPGAVQDFFKAEDA